MPSVTRVQEAAEAILGALHRLDWRPMDPDAPDQGASTWFIRGEKPKQLRVEVQRSLLADYVIVNAEWPVLTNPPHKGRLTFNINVGESTQRQVRENTEKIVVRCLELFRDVLQGSGVADPNRKKEATDDES